MPTGPIRVSEIPVTNSDAEEFIASLESAMAALSLQDLRDLYLIAQEKRAIAISFDANWRPFLGFTRGYNVPLRRAHLEGNPALLANVADALAALLLEIPGGRVFIRQHNASKVVDGLETTLCVYDWPGDNPVHQVLEILQRLMSSRTC